MPNDNIIISWPHASIHTLPITWCRRWKKKTDGFEDTTRWSCPCSGSNVSHYTVSWLVVRLNPSILKLDSGFIHFCNSYHSKFQENSQNFKWKSSFFIFFLKPEVEAELRARFVPASVVRSKCRHSLSMPDSPTGAFLDAIFTLAHRTQLTGLERRKKKVVTRKKRWKKGACK